MTGMMAGSTDGDSTSIVRLGLDRSYARHGSTIVGGSPLRVIRLSAAGVEAAHRIESAAGAPVERSALTDRLMAIGAAHPIPNRPGRYSPSEVTIVMPIHRCPATDTASTASTVSTANTTDTANPSNTVNDITTVVVDDGSDPPIVGATVRLDINRGPAAARMAGLDQVTTPLVAFVDDDVDLGPSGAPDDWLEGLLGHFDDDAVALVAPRVMSGGPAVATSTARRIADYEHRHSPLDLGERPARIAPGTAVSYVPAAAIVCRVDALRAVGGFDTALRVGEDVDLVWRLVAAGYICRYEPTVVVEHRPRPTWSAFARQRIAYGSSSAALAERGHSLAPVRANGWSLGIWALVIAGHPLLAGAVAGATAGALVRRLPMLPAAVSIRLALEGTGQVGRSAATAVRRVWWPLIVPIALVSRRARRVLFAAIIAAGHPLVVFDDVGFSIGVWRGILTAARSRSPHRRRAVLGPILPEVTPWPRRPTPVPASGPAPGASQPSPSDDPVRSEA